MKRLLIPLLVMVFVGAVYADQELKYGPAEVTVTGTMKNGKQKHPNGSWIGFTLIKLDTPAFIKGDGEEDSCNVDEKNIKEIQISSTEEGILKKLAPKDGKKITVTGTIFHAHTAYHVRELVLMVTAVK